MRLTFESGHDLWLTFSRPGISPRLVDLRSWFFTSFKCTSSESHASSRARVRLDAQRILSSAQRILSSAERILSSLERILSLAKRILSRAKRILSPAERFLSPGERILSPAERILLTVASRGGIACFMAGRRFYRRGKLFRVCRRARLSRAACWPIGSVEAATLHGVGPSQQDPLLDGKLS
jgi:hypothetical protein